MSQATNSGENIIADALGGAGATTRYVQLHTGGAGELGTANVASNSTRKPVTFGAASGGVAASTSAPKWTNVPASETYVNWSLWTTVTGGVSLCYGAISPNVSVEAGDNFEFPIGDLTITGS